MSEIAIGGIGIFVLLFLFLLRVPVAFCMAIVGFSGFAYFTSPAAGLSILSRDIFEQFSSYSLSCIPMFILMGTFAFAFEKFLSWYFNVNIITDERIVDVDFIGDTLLLSSALSW